MKSGLGSLSKLEKRLEDLEKKLKVNRVRVVHPEDKENNIKIAGGEIRRIVLRWDDSLTQNYKDVGDNNQK